MTIEFLSKGELDNFLHTAGYSGGVLSRFSNLVNSQLWDNLPDIIRGMYVCVNISTNDYDSGYLLFGAVNEVLYDPDSKNGYTLMVHKTEPNSFEIVEDHNAAFEQWWSSVEGKDRNGYLLDKESAREGYNAAIAMNNI